MRTVREKLQLRAKWYNHLQHGHLVIKEETISFYVCTVEDQFESRGRRATRPHIVRRDTRWARQKWPMSDKSQVKRAGRWHLHATGNRTEQHVWSTPAALHSVGARDERRAVELIHQAVGHSSDLMHLMSPATRHDYIVIGQTRRKTAYR